MASSLRIIAACAFVHLSVAQAPLALYKLDADFAAEYGAACLDGTPPGLYALVQDPTKWIIFLEGGGWCFDTTPAGTISNCAGRAQGGGGSSNGMGSSMNVGGLLSSDPAVNPHFWNYSLVFMHYCDGTSFSGNATAPVPVPPEIRAALEAQAPSAPQQIWFRGRANLRAMWVYLEQRLNMSMATDMSVLGVARFTCRAGVSHAPPALPLHCTCSILSGGSAGASAAYYALDTVASWVGPETRLVGAPDAGFFLDAFNVGRNSTWYRDCFQAADPIWNSSASGGLNADCLKAYPAAPWHCFLQQYAAQYISTPLMVLNSAYDQWQILNDLGLGCVPSTTGQPVAGVPSCNAAQMAVFQQYRLAQLQAVAPVLAGYPHNGAFIDSCFVHEQNVDYCSGQSLPNCVGWDIFAVNTTSGPLTMDDAFALWYASLGGARWPAVKAARAAHREAVVIPRLTHPNGFLGRPAATLPSTTLDPEAGVVQIIDAVAYPANPSCPFPTPAPSPPPSTIVRLMTGGQCLRFNASSFPCFGASDFSACAIALGPCGGEPGDRWAIPAGGASGPFTSADVKTPDGLPVVINIDCDKYSVAGTVAWALGSSAAPLAFNAASGVIAISGSSTCLNGGQTSPNAPCGGGDQKFALSNQIQVAPCSAPSSKGWVAQSAGAAY